MTTASPRLRSFVTCLLLGACAQDPPPASMTRAPIVGGVDASDPAVVVILVDGEGDCTGSLVAPDVVLTAAHCILEDIPAGAVFTVFTGPDLAQPDGGETVDVAMARPNPAWDLEDDSGDVAVLVLARPLAIPPVRINRTPLTEDLVGQAARMVGYGDTTVMEPTSGFGRRLQATRPLLDFDHDWVVVGDATGNQCYGDSGGPVFMTIGGSEVIVGVNSWGPHDDCDTFSYNARIDGSLPFVDMYVPPSSDPPPGGEDMDDIDDGDGSGGGGEPGGEPGGEDDDPTPPPDTGGCTIAPAAPARPGPFAGLTFVLCLVGALTAVYGGPAHGKTRASSPRKAP